MTLNTFLMAMISYPDALRRLQNELDACCGDGMTSSLRLTSLSDMSSLSYCAATVKEVIRWRPGVPVAPQHHITVPLEYDGYYFPPGTDFVINMILVGLPEWTEDQDIFRPERFIDGNNGEFNIIQDFWGFGGGRRICAGYRPAQQSLSVSMARIAYCFNITATGDFDNHNLNHQCLVEPFPVKIELRSEAHRMLILTEAAKVK
jgi:cytochrome P450